jgi:hypothetical protein
MARHSGANWQNFFSRHSPVFRTDLNKFVCHEMKSIAFNKAEGAAT